MCKEPTGLMLSVILAFECRGTDKNIRLAVPGSENQNEYLLESKGF
jgi:hypothetical protein